MKIYRVCISEEGAPADYASEVYWSLDKRDAELFGLKACAEDPEYFSAILTVHKAPENILELTGWLNELQI